MPIAQDTQNQSDAILAALKVLYAPGQVVELRVPKGGKDGTISGFFNKGKFLAAAAAELSGGYPGIYTTLNPLRADLLERSPNRITRNADKGTLATDADVVARRWLLVDVDPVRPADVSSSEEERDAAFTMAADVAEYMAGRGWPDPIMADSGNGAHLLYRVDLPNDDASKALVHGVLRRLAAEFNTDALKIDTKVANASRICKVYGTLSAKGQATSERPHRVAGLIRVPGQVEVLTAEQLADFQPVEDDMPPAPPMTPPAQGDDGVRKYVIAALDGAIRTICAAGPGTRNDTVNSEAYGVFRWVAGGFMSKPMAWAGLEQAALSIGLEKSEVNSTLHSAWSAAEKKPRTAAEVPERRFAPRPARPVTPESARGDQVDPDTGEILEAPEAANDNAPTSEFGQPIDLFGIQPPPELQLDMLPAPLVAYVQDQAALTGCDPAIIGVCSLVAAAACITDGIRLQPKRHDPTWTESARLWAAVVGDPSTKKSPAISKAVRHVKRLDHRMAEENASAMSDWRWQHDQWKEAKKADKSNPPPEPEEPKKKRLMVEDITVESLVDVLKDNSRGVLTLKDELTGWFASMDAYKGSTKGASMDRAHWLESYNGGRRSIDRVVRGSVIVPNWSTCIIGGIQPDMIRRVASSMGNDGLLQRFMIVCARPAVIDEDRTPDMRAMDAFGELFDQLVGLQACNDVVTLTEAAHRSREKVARYAKRLIDAIDHPHLQAWLGKWDGLYARLLLLYHVIDCASRRVYPTSEQVEAETADQVERLMCGFLLHHAIHFYTEIIDANERQEHVRQLARLILAKGFTKLTKRDIAQSWKASRRMEWWELKAVVDALCVHDWLAPDEADVGSDGKPRSWWVNQAVHSMFGAQADRERSRRNAATAALRELKETYSEASA